MTFILDDIQNTKLATELCAKWGSETQRVVHELNKLVATALSQGDILGYAFISQCVARVLLEATEMAQQIQATRGPSEGDTVQ